MEYANAELLEKISKLIEEFEHEYETVISCELFVLKTVSTYYYDDGKFRNVKETQ